MQEHSTCSCRGGALCSVLQEASGSEAGHGDHGPVPEEGRGGEARRHRGHAHRLEGGLHLRQVVQVAGRLADGRPKVHLPRPSDWRQDQLHRRNALVYCLQERSHASIFRKQRTFDKPLRLPVICPDQLCWVHEHMNGCSVQ